MQQQVPPRLKTLSVITAAGLYLVLIMGDLVTNTGSQNGCGQSWPLCHGRFMPLANLHSLIEFSHRFIVGIVGILVIITAIWAWRALSARKDVKFFAVVSVLFVLIQAWLGAVAVLEPQPTAVLALHFGISLIALAAQVLLAVVLFQVDAGDPYRQLTVPGRFRLAAWSVLIYTYLVVYTGAYVRHSGADLACHGWPLCNGALVPTLSGLTGVQFGHRLAALLAILAAGWLVYLARATRDARPDLYRGALLAFGLVLAQALDGAYVVLSLVSTPATMSHGAIVALLFTALSYLCLQTWQAPAPQAVAPQANG